MVRTLKGVQGRSSICRGGKNESIGSFIAHPCTNCRTSFQNDDISRATELMLGDSQECSKWSAEKLLNFFCRLHLNSAGFIDQMLLLKACEKISSDKIFKSLSHMNMEIKMLSGMTNSGKETQHIFYRGEQLEVTRPHTMLACEYHVFRMSRLWITDNFRTTHCTCKSRAHTMDTSFLKEASDFCRNT